MTPAAMLVLSVTLAGGLWPFGGADEGQKDTELTLQDLRRRARPATPAADSAASTAAPDEETRAARAAEAMEAYRRFLTLEAGTPAMRAEATRRLADLSLEAGIAADAAAEAQGAGRAHYSEAVRLYRELLSTGLPAETEEQVLYQLARALDGSGQADEALATLDRLVVRGGAGHRRAEAEFRRGETYFVRKDYAAAEAAYAAVLAAGEDSGFYEQGLYKLGWSRFKLSRLDEALDAFLTLLDRRLGALDDPATGIGQMSRAERELIDDTLRVTSITWSYLDGADSIETQVRRRGERAWHYLLYASLGELYLEKKRFQDAAETFNAYVDRYPAAEPAPFLQQSAIEAYVQGGFPTLVLAAKREYVERYGLDGDWWAGRDPAARTAAEGEVVGWLKTHLTDLATHDHAAAQRSGAPEDYARAADWYRRFLAYFPADPESARRSFLLGELLFESRQYAEARDAYLRSAYEYGGHPQAAEAAYAALLAAREHEQLLAGEAKAAWHAENIPHALRFAETFPEHPQAAPVLSTVAEELFAAGELERAIQVAALVLTLQPPANRNLERVAWTVTAHAQFDLARYAEAEQSYLRLRTFDLTAEQRAGVEDRLAAAIYRQAEMARTAGDVDRAVADFLRVGSTVPGSDIRVNALYDAATLLLAQERWSEAAPLLERFRAENPGHALVDQVTINLASAYRADGRSAAAATEFERLAADPRTTDEVRRQALWEAADLYAKAGDTVAEARVCEILIARFPEPFEEALEARQRRAALAAAAGDWVARRHWLGEIIAADDRAGARRTDRSRQLAALAAIELARPARDAFLAVRLTVPLDRSLKLKRARMEEALAAYARAANYGVAEVTTAATFETAELYYQLSQDLLASERPPELSDEEREQYDLLLEEQAFPFEEKAIGIYEANTARAGEGIYDEWVRASFARLASIAPARFARAERSQGVAPWID